MAALDPTYWRTYRSHYMVLIGSLVTMAALSYIWMIPVSHEDVLALIVYFFLLLFVDSLPLRLQGVNLFFSLGISIAVMMRYGIIV